MVVRANLNMGMVEVLADTRHHSKVVLSIPLLAQADTILLALMLRNRVIPLSLSLWGETDHPRFKHSKATIPSPIRTSTICVRTPGPACASATTSTPTQ